MIKKRKQHNKSWTRWLNKKGNMKVILFCIVALIIVFVGVAFIYKIFTSQDFNITINGDVDASFVKL